MKTTIISTVMALLFLVSCKTTQQSTNHVGTGKMKFAPLKRSEYKVLGSVTASATVQHILWFTIGAEKQGDYVVQDSNSVFGLSKGDKAAVYLALQKMPGADAVIFPRFERDYFSVPFFYTKETVTVKTKAISLTSN